MDFLFFVYRARSPFVGCIVLTAGAGIGASPKTAVPGGSILVVVLMAMALPSRMSVGVLLPMLRSGTCSP